MFLPNLIHLDTIAERAMTAGPCTEGSAAILKADPADAIQPRHPLPVLWHDQSVAARLKRASRPAAVLTILLSVLIGVGTFLGLRLERPILAPVPDEATIGAVLAAGGLYHVDVDELDHRALVEARIRNLRDTPDVVVIADRSWQLLQQDMRWQQRVFGAYIDVLKPSDVRRVMDRFISTGRLPKKVVLGVEPDFFLQKHRSMTLAAVGPDAGSTEPSEGNVQNVVKRQSSAAIRNPAHRPRPGLAPYDATLDTIYPDGSVIWSTQRKGALAEERPDQAALGQVQELRQRVKSSTLAGFVETGEIIADTKSRGTEVVIALTPLHPQVYARIYNRWTSQRLHEAVEDLLAVARALDVVTLGSFEPFAAGCKAADFASVATPAPSCLSRLLHAGFVAGLDDQDRLDGFIAAASPVE